MGLYAFLVSRRSFFLPAFFCREGSANTGIGACGMSGVSWVSIASGSSAWSFWVVSAVMTLAAVDLCICLTFFHLRRVDLFSLSVKSFIVFILAAFLSWYLAFFFARYAVWATGSSYIFLRFSLMIRAFDFQCFFGGSWNKIKTPFSFFSYFNRHSDIILRLFSR